MSRAKAGLVERLKGGAGSVLCAEGYLFEIERRGYLKAGAYVPEVVLDHPEVVAQLHKEFLRCGTDIVEAFTYYAHREKLKAIGREDDLERMNRAALQIAKDAAAGTDALVAGNICNTGAYDLDNLEASREEVRQQFTEQVSWAKEAGVDFVIAETISYSGEADIALEVIKSFDLPAVVMFTSHKDRLKDDVSYIGACKKLAEKGAAAVGFNCGRGPLAMLPLLRDLREAVQVPIAALPVPYRTTPKQPSFQSLVNSASGKSAYTTNLDEFLCTRDEMADFARQAYDIGVEFIGICCGAGPHHVRAMAEALGRTTKASWYSPDMSQHYLIGKEGFVKQHEEPFLDHFGVRK